MEFLCLDFVNSSWYITHKSFSEPLRDSEWLVKLAAKYDMKLLPVPDEETLEELIEMRNQFAALLDRSITGNGLSESDVSLVNNYMSSVSFHRELLCADGICMLHEVPYTLNWSWFMAETAASLSKLCTSELLNNLKKCQNPECGWFFIDKSKSGNRKWCDETCSNFMKVRRFRQKKRNTQ